MSQKINVSKINFAILLICSAAMIFWGSVLFLADGHFTKGQKFLRAKNYDAAGQEFQKSIFLNPNPNYYRSLALHFIAKNDNLAAIGDKNHLGAAQNLMASAINFDFYESENHNIYAQILLRKKDLSGAEKHFLEAIKLDPFNHLEYYIGLSMLYFQEKRFDEADKINSWILEKFTPAMLDDFKLQEDSMIRIYEDPNIRFYILDDLRVSYRLQADIKMAKGENEEAEKMLKILEDIDRK